MRAEGPTASLAPNDTEWQLEDPGFVTAYRRHLDEIGVDGVLRRVQEAVPAAPPRPGSTARRPPRRCAWEGNVRGAGR
jgi:hypothetical protein